MNQKRCMPEPKPSRLARWVRAGLTGVFVAGAAAGAGSGCLDRELAEPVPRTSNVFVDQIRQTAVDKIDLLFVVDNSVSMADKQQILKDAVPGLLQRLINPNCQNITTGELKAGPGAGLDCEAGWDREFNPVDNIHIGVVSSSLGAHGGNSFCVPTSASWNETQDDKGWLLGRVRTGLSTYQGLGFLAWDPTGKKKNPPGESSGDALIKNFQDMVVATGENGCGFEAPLEAWYRFLIDPEPPKQIVVENNQAKVVDIDTDVLAQRKAFLRPDSLVAIIMLTDENDCSVVDGGVGWLVTSTRIGTKALNMPGGTSTCETDPNSPCCRPCGLLNVGTPEGCVPVKEDPACQQREFLSGRDDNAQIRCFDHKRRFGYDFLYSPARYANALKFSTIRTRSGTEVVNPLYADLTESETPAPPRDPALVFLAGIVGVPWQDIADDSSLEPGSKGLRYLTPAELTQKGRWDMILPNGATPPLDPLMHETPRPRDGANPVTGEALAPTSSTNPQANRINGHEFLNDKADDPTIGNDDLQYACIFPLAAPRDCSDENLANACDCAPNDLWRNRPLCNPPAGGPAGTTQHYAKAYPGTRVLQVLKDFGSNSIVASICPKVLDGNTGDANYGYNPAVGAIVERLKEVLGGRCLPRELSTDSEGRVQCAVVEAAPGSGACDCNKPGRTGEPPANVATAVYGLLAKAGACSGAACQSYCLCELEQLLTPECRDNVDPGNAVGYCYIDPLNPDESRRVGNPELVKPCRDTEKRLLRFVGDNTPASGAITFIACQGASVTGN
jgi:hypothetical protein